MWYLFSVAFFKKTLKYLQGKYKMILWGGFVSDKHTYVYDWGYSKTRVSTLADTSQHEKTQKQNELTQG